MSLKIKPLGRVTLNLIAGQAVALNSQTVPGQIWLLNASVNKASVMSLVATSVPGVTLVYGPVSAATQLMIVAGNDDTYYEVGTAPVVKQVTNDNGNCVPVAVNTSATLTVAQLLAGVITSTTAAAVTGTLPTGTLFDAGSTFAVGEYVDFSVVATGANAFTIATAAGWTVGGAGGSAAVATATSGRFRAVKTAANTFVLYRLS